MIRAQHALPSKLAALSVAGLLMLSAQAVQAAPLQITAGGSSSSLGQGEGPGDPFMDSFETDGINAFDPLSGTNGQSFYLSGTKSREAELFPGVFLTDTVSLFGEGSSELIQPSANNVDGFSLDSAVLNAANAIYLYTAGPLSIKADYTLSETIPGIATLDEVFTISWQGEEPPGEEPFESASFVFTLFTNPDLVDGDAGGDTATFDLVDTFTQTDGAASFTMTANVTGTTPDTDNWEINNPDALLVRLDNTGSSTELSDTNVTGASEGDQSFARQFGFVDFRPDSEDIVITVTKTFTTGTAATQVPEPTSIALLAAGGLLLLGAARRTRDAA